MPFPCDFKHSFQINNKYKYLSFICPYQFNLYRITEKGILNDLEFLVSYRKMKEVFDIQSLEFLNNDVLLLIRETSLDLFLITPSSLDTSITSFS
jgi:hypothetical protein